MSYVMVDVEADGPCPGLYSMVTFGAVIVDPKLDKTFYGELKPISEKWIPEALKVGGYTREQTLGFPQPKEVMEDFYSWLKNNTDGRIIFMSDNNGFDWQFINYYFHAFLGENPFGHSSGNLGWFYKGVVRNTHKNFKHLRKTKHTHHPVDDSIGNAEAMLEVIKTKNIKIKL